MQNLPLAQPPYRPNEERSEFQQRTKLDEEFLTVNSDELGFALTVFFSAANKRLGAPGFGNAESLGDCEQFLLGVARGLPSEGEHGGNRRSREASLEVSFLSLWQHYECHELRRSICARVLGFHFLMQGTGGEVIQDWMEMCPDQPEAVALHPAVIDALALVPLDRAGGLDRRVFIRTIELVAANNKDW